MEPHPLKFISLKTIVAIISMNLNSMFNRPRISKEMKLDSFISRHRVPWMLISTLARLP